MLDPQQKKEVRQIVDALLVEFKGKYMSFRSKRIADTPTDVKQISTSDSVQAYVVSYVASQLVNYFPLSGGSLNDGANISVGTSTGTEIATSASEKLGFWGHAPVIRQTVTGSRGGNAALASLIAALAAEGLIRDSTTP